MYRKPQVLYPKIAGDLPQSSWVPHISLVFREMWDTTDLDVHCQLSEYCRCSAVVSHISRKTSEMWGTQLCVVSSGSFLLRGRLHGKRLTMDTGLYFGNGAVIDRNLRGLALNNKAVAYS